MKITERLRSCASNNFERPVKRKFTAFKIFINKLTWFNKYLRRHAAFEFLNIGIEFLGETHMKEISHLDIY